jgi:hypothetical protein
MECERAFEELDALVSLCACGGRGRACQLIFLGCPLNHDCGAWRVLSVGWEGGVG